MDYEVGKFGDDFPQIVGIDCGTKQGNRGFITVEECLQCPGINYVRCYPRQWLLSMLRKQVSKYYGPKWGIYHVSDINMCGASFLFKRFVGNFYSTRSLWNMRFGTEIHSWYNADEVSQPKIEQGLEHIFDSDGRKMAIVGSQDSVFEKLDLDVFTDVKDKIFDDLLLKYVFEPSIEEGRYLKGVICDRKSTISMKSVMLGPNDYHIQQLVKYVVLRDKKDVSCVMITYLDKYEGREINHILPIVYTDSPLYEDCGEDVLSRCVVINKDKILQTCRDKASTFENCLVHGYMPLRMPAFKQECNWCAYASACKYTPNMPIMDKGNLEMKIKSWKTMLRVSEHFTDAEFGIQETIKRWESECSKEFWIHPEKLRELKRDCD